MSATEARVGEELRRRAAAGEGRARVVITRVAPEIEGGRFAIKRTVGEAVRVEADAFADGHNASEE